jgi:spore germination protein YaaH
VTKISILLIILFFAQTTWSQEHKSIHQLDYEAHRHLAKKTSYFDESGVDIIPLNQEKVNTLRANVFGYLPDWMYSSSRQYLQYDLLSHLAAFDFTVSSTGAISYPGYWPWTDVISKAHQNGVKVIMTAVNFDKDEIRTILTNSTVKSTFFKNVKDILLIYNLDGVNIDFEGLYTADRGSLLNAFMQDLTAYIKANVVGAEISFAGPAVNWGGWDLWNLAQACDYVFIMGYAFYGSWSSTSGPGAPLIGGTYNITNTVDVQYSQATKLTPEKLILGVPYYGSRWQTIDNSAYSGVIDYINHPRFLTAKPESQTAGLLWDTKSQTPWYRYQEDTKWFQVWFDDETSLSLKYDLADAREYRGVGMWALGYDNGRSELWDELRRRYSVTATANKQNNALSIPNKFELLQNYPNPFNSSTEIRWQLAVGSDVEISVYNMLGEKVTNLVTGFRGPGSHSYHFDASDLASGVYYYQLVTSEFTQVKKMILLQ